MMRLLGLPQFERFRGDETIKVLRHRDTRWDLWALRRAGKFDWYQNGQGWDAFGDARYVISFIAERNKYAKFVGVWEVLSKHEKKTRGFRYRTRELLGFDDLEGRLVVQWGEGTRSWTQWLHRKGDKEIFELLPPNYVKRFPGFYDFTLTHNELVTIINNPDSHRDWQRMLSSNAGVYLITDEHTGRQYVGSASGVGGIWARWRHYAQAPSGGNIQLKELLKKDRNRYKKFRFSILRVLEPNVTRGQVLAQEALVKQKLGSKASGLNSN